MEKHIILDAEGNTRLQEDSKEALEQKLNSYGLTIHGGEVLSLATLPFSPTKYIYKVEKEES
ncbi:MAG: hypothetical protein RIQ54_358 [Candidatus Parcubacteria bacterium]|jgi:hypothetical protein